MSERVGESEAILPPSQQTTGLGRESTRGRPDGRRRVGGGEQGGRRRYHSRGYGCSLAAHDSLVLGFLYEKLDLVMRAQNL